MSSMRRGVAALGRLAGPNLGRQLQLQQHSRSSSVFKSFKDTLQKEIDKNPELQRTIKELRNDETLAKASQAARDAASKVQSTVSQAADIASEQASKAADIASEQASKAADQATKASEHIASKGAEAAQKAQQAASEATQSFTGSKAADEQQQTSSQASDADGGSKADSEQAASTPPLYVRLMDDASSLFASLQAKVNAAADSAAASARTSSAPPPPPQSDAAGGGAGEEAAAANSLVVREPTFWERNFNQESPFFERVRGLFGSAGGAAGAVGDGVFGETEQAEAMRELRQVIPDFSQEGFLQEIGETMGPAVLQAYLKGDTDVLRAKCRDQAYATLQASVVDRQHRQLLMDTRILHMSEPELEGIRIIRGLPTPIVAFETHQVYCLRNSLTGKIVEGDEDDIRAFHYLWALQPNEESDSEDKWQVTELAVRGVMETF